MAECLVVRNGRTALLQTRPVAVDQPCPYVAGGPQKLIAALSLPVRQTQADPGGPVDQLGGGKSHGSHIERMF
jgi:hypothetical protein